MRDPLIWLDDEGLPYLAAGPVPDRVLGGMTDPVLVDLRRANVARHIAEGRTEASWELGRRIGAALMRQGDS